MAIEKLALQYSILDCYWNNSLCNHNSDRISRGFIDLPMYMRISFYYEEVSHSCFLFRTLVDICFFYPFFYVGRAYFWIFSEGFYSGSP